MAFTLLNIGMYMYFFGFDSQRKKKKRQEETKQQQQKVFPSVCCSSLPVSSHSMTCGQHGCQHYILISQVYTHAGLGFLVTGPRSRYPHRNTKNYLGELY